MKIRTTHALVRAMVRKGATVSLLALASGSALAAGAGDNVVDIGWFRINNNVSSDPLTTSLNPPGLGALVGAPTGSFTSAGTSASVDDADTFALVFTHFFTSHIAASLDIGLPARLHVSGHGVIDGVNLNLDDAAYTPLASVREWAPVVLAKYFFLAPEAQFRPFLGLGINYTWFSNVTLNQNFQDTMNANADAIAPFAGESGPATTSARASSSWNPVFNGGFVWRLSRRFGITASASYLPLKTTAEIDTLTASGSPIIVSKTRVSLDPVVTALMVDYHF